MSRPSERRAYRERMGLPSPNWEDHAPRYVNSLVGPSNSQDERESDPELAFDQVRHRCRLCGAGIAARPFSHVEGLAHLEAEHPDWRTAVVT